MASSLIKLEPTINNIAPGQWTTRHWNNATPPNAVWHIQGVPRESSFTTDSPTDQSLEVEVTRVWRKLNRTLVVVVSLKRISLSMKSGT
jgi:hypothetical protein